jgi:hypothetical protein
LAAAPAWSQNDKKLSAREVFYSAPAEASPAKPASAQKKTTPKSASAAQKKPQAEIGESRGGTAASSGAGRIPSGGQVVMAAYDAGHLYPLGLRYSILKRDGDSSVEVSSGEMFHSGDRIRLRVESNADGYLYIIHRGSSGTWKPLFPSSEFAAGSNRIEKGRVYDIPRGYVFTFDEQPGEEKVFLVLARQPEADLERLIYSLSDSPQAPPAEAVQPAEAKILLAQNLVNIEDGVVDRLRNVYARDLIVEKVDEVTPSAAAPAGEKAVYVVNPARAGDSRVVADLTLSHR